MKMKPMFAAAAIGALLAGPVFAQAGSVGPAPGVPDTDTQSQITKPGEADRSDGGSRSEREARDDKGAERATGDQLGPPAGVDPSTQQVRMMLEKQGYTNIEGLREQGGIYTGRAMKDGKAVDIRVDPQQAKIEEQDR